MAITLGEAHKVVAATRPRGDFRGAVIGCGRMGSTIDDEHIHMPHYPWPWTHAQNPPLSCWPSWPSLPHRFEYGAGEVWQRACASRVAVDHRSFSPVLICIG